VTNKSTLEPSLEYMWVHPH